MSLQNKTNISEEIISEETNTSEDEYILEEPEEVVQNNLSKLQVQNNLDKQKTSLKYKESESESESESGSEYEEVVIRKKIK